VPVVRFLASTMLSRPIRNIRKCVRTGPLIGHVDNDLQPFACRRETRLDTGLVRAHAMVQPAACAGDLLGVVPQEIRTSKYATAILNGVDSP